MSMSSIEYIIHFSDIHIGSGERSKEYRIIFDKIGSSIKECPFRDKLIICISGDIFHNKIKYSGEDVDDFNYLIASIGKEIPLIIIPGNHDMNLNNKEKIDLITPLIKELQQNYKNINYWLETGVYMCQGIKFIHISVKDGTTDILKMVKDNPKSIMLYHGMINNARMNNMIIKDTRITSEIMDNVSMMLLGDNHEHQFIRPYIGYAGSLIQQNIGETVKKGFILWNIKERKGQFVPIENESGYVKIDMRGIKTEDEISKTIALIQRPKNILKLSMITDANDELCKRQIEEIKSKYGKIDRVEKVEIYKEPSVIENQLEVLKEILQKNSAKENQIKQIIDEYSKRITQQEYKKWYIESMEWSNMYKYGSDNYIDFTKLNGISGIVAPNRSGKTSIIDILIFGLYGKTLRGNKENMIHIGTKTSQVKITFVVNGVRYYISRRDKPPHAEICLSKYINEKWENITEKTTTETHHRVEGLIGDLDEFLTTGLYYEAIHDIIRMDKMERFKVLPKLFGLIEGNILIKELKSKLKEIREKKLSLQKSRIDDPIKLMSEFKLRLEETKKRLIKTICELNEIEEKKNIMISQLGEITDDNKLSNVKETINQLITANKKIETDISELDKKITKEIYNLELNTEIVDPTDLLIKPQIPINIIGDITELKKIITEYESDKDWKGLKELEHIRDLMNNINIAGKSIEIITKEIDKLKSVLQEKKKRINTNVNFDISKLTSEIQIINTTILSIKLEEISEIPEIQGANVIITNDLNNELEKLIKGRKQRNDISKIIIEISRLNEEITSLANIQGLKFDDKCERCQENKKTLEIRSYKDRTSSDLVKDSVQKLDEKKKALALEYKKIEEETNQIKLEEKILGIKKKMAEYALIKLNKSKKENNEKKEREIAKLKSEIETKRKSVDLGGRRIIRSEEHTSELQSRLNSLC